jgi:myo-inositol 2-dehydrogenase/D-chiro-inositol 1-dehydrogenase
MRGEGPLQVAVVGAGAMGGDHVARLARRIHGAQVAAVVEPDPSRQEAAIARAPGALGFPRLEDAIEGVGLDAVLIASPGPAHEAALLAALTAGLAILCEKPMAPDADTARRIVEAERQLREAPCTQVGFMRRFDVEYGSLHDLIASGSAGNLLLLHCVHRNARAFPGFTEEMMITDAVVHELDILPWLAGSPIRSVEVKRGRRNSLSPPDLGDPLLVLVELESGVLGDVEMNMGAQFGYQVTTEAVLESGVARIGQPAGLELWHQGRAAIAEHQGFITRFRAAYDREVQAWVDAAHQGAIGGPSAWDGYLAALACEAGVQALRSGGAVPVRLPERPPFYA